MNAIRLFAVIALSSAFCACNDSTIPSSPTEVSGPIATPAPSPSPAPSSAPEALYSLSLSPNPVNLEASPGERFDWQVHFRIKLTNLGDIVGHVTYIRVTATPTWTRYLEYSGITEHFGRNDVQVGETLQLPATFRFNLAPDTLITFPHDVLVNVQVRDALGIRHNYEATLVANR